MASTEPRAVPLRSHGGVIFGSEFLRILDPQPQSGASSDGHADAIATGGPVSTDQLQRPPPLDGPLRPSSDDVRSLRRQESGTSFASGATTSTLFRTQAEDLRRDRGDTHRLNNDGGHSSTTSTFLSSSDSPALPERQPPSAVLRQIKNLRRKVTTRTDQMLPATSRQKFGRKFAPGMSMNHHRSSTTTVKTSSISTLLSEAEKVRLRVTLSPNNKQVIEDSHISASPIDSPSTSTEKSLTPTYDDYDYYNYYYYTDDIDSFFGDVLATDTTSDKSSSTTETPVKLTTSVRKATTDMFLRITTSTSTTASATSSPRLLRTTRTTKSTATTPSPISTTAAETTKSPSTRPHLRYLTTTEKSTNSTRTSAVTRIRADQSSSSLTTARSAITKKPSVSSTSEQSVTVSSQKVTTARQTSISATEKSKLPVNSTSESDSVTSLASRGSSLVNKPPSRTESSSRSRLTSRTLSQSVLKTSRVSSATSSRATQSLPGRKSKVSSSRSTSTLQFRYTTSRPSTEKAVEVTTERSSQDKTVGSKVTQRGNSTRTQIPKTPENFPDRANPDTSKSEMLETIKDSTQQRNDQLTRSHSIQTHRNNTEDVNQEENGQTTRLGIASSSSVVVEVRVESPTRSEPRRMPANAQSSTQIFHRDGDNKENKNSSASLPSLIKESPPFTPSPVSSIKNENSSTSLATTSSTAQTVHTINSDHHTTSFLLSEPLVVEFITEPKMSERSPSVESKSAANSQRPIAKSDTQPSASQPSEGSKINEGQIHTQTKAPVDEEASKITNTQEIAKVTENESQNQQKFEEVEAVNQTQSQSVITSISRAEAITAETSTSVGRPENSTNHRILSASGSTTTVVPIVSTTILPSANVTNITSNQTLKNTTRNSRLIVGSPLAQQGLAPQGLAPFGQSPGGLAPFGNAPEGLAPKGLIPTGLHPHGLAPQGVPGNETAGNNTRLTFVDANVKGGADANNTVGYVVEEHNRSRFRLEEKTRDGFIIGEYGVVDHVTGDVNGVRYTADSSADPHLIYETLMKFLQL